MTEGPTPVHQACLYGSDDEFVAMALPFVNGGLADGDPVLVAAPVKNLQLLQDALGSQADQVDFVDNQDFDGGAEERVLGVRDYVRGKREVTPERGHVRIISEPVWVDIPAHQTAQSVRIESMANVIYAGVKVWFICAYDTRTTPPKVLKAARQTHPQLVTGDRVSDNDDYVDPYQFIRAQDAQPLPDPPTEAPSLTFASDLEALRRFVSDHVTAQGMADGHAEMAVMAVYETAAWMRQPTESIPDSQCDPAADEPAPATDRSHQAPPMTIRIWSQSGTPVVDLWQSGARLANPFLGYQPPTLEPAPDDGLWLARMISARLDIRRDEHSSSVRLHLPRTGDE